MNVLQFKQDGDELFSFSHTSNRLEQESSDNQGEIRLACSATSVFFVCFLSNYNHIKKGREHHIVADEIKISFESFLE